MTKHSLKILALFFVGILIRLILASTIPYGHDIEAWDQYATYAQQGKWTPYEALEDGGRYKYSPVWFWIITFVSYLTQVFGGVFTTNIRFFLAFIDALTFLLLWKITQKENFTPKQTLLSLGLFFLNPISFQISGFLGQFDNIALFWILAAYYCWSYLAPRIQGVFLLFLSFAVCVKHFALMIVPVFALRAQGIWKKILTLSAPPILFLLILLPYYAISDPYWVSHHVFKYNLHAGYWGWSGVICRGVLALTGSDLIQEPWFHYLDYFNTVLYGVMILLTFWLVRRFDLLDSILAMFMIFYTFTTQMAPQYTIWPIPFAVLRPNRYLYAYTAVGGVQLAAYFYSHYHWYFKLPFQGTFANLVPETFVIFRYFTWIVCVFWLAHIMGWSRKKQSVRMAIS